MNVRDLEKFLENFPGDMPILIKVCSDYHALEADQITVVGAVDQGGYIMREHPTMSADNKRRRQSYLLFPGN
jgi:hypothetical protein